MSNRITLTQAQLDAIAYCMRQTTELASAARHHGNAEDAALHYNRAAELADIIGMRNTARALRGAAQHVCGEG